jgi:UDP-N-acetylmuramoyl-L-alanyl-D-glutamate--2,6-diaminopimelate ligase
LKHFDNITGRLTREERIIISRDARIEFPLQPENIVAITGTNGKTSTAIFYAQIFELLKCKAIAIGTLGIVAPYAVIQKNVSIDQNHNLVPDSLIPTASCDDYFQNPILTTPSPENLHKFLHKLHSENVTHVAIETSSIGLDQHRADEVYFKAAAFTNLTSDHIDVHKTYDHYQSSKLRLFKHIIPEYSSVIAHYNLECLRELGEICTNRKLKLLQYGYLATPEQDGLYAVSKIKLSNGWALTLMHIVEKQNKDDFSDYDKQLEQSLYECNFYVESSFQVDNLLCAILLAYCSSSFAICEILAIVNQIKGIEGRMDRLIFEEIIN